jgi:hypothetical protein
MQGRRKMKKDAEVKPCVLRNLTHPREDFVELTLRTSNHSRQRKRGLVQAPFFLN